MMGIIFFCCAPRITSPVVFYFRNLGHTYLQYQISGLKRLGWGKHHDHKWKIQNCNPRRLAMLGLANKCSRFLVWTIQ
ncbi:hypothetical protein OWV82_014347 [Melia azedarach]|uniref:Uncharacterized protein n=1 Tax=Melia azedarach TaxID=155640 RepID=A0ACC1XMC5_MELAZ|nr:hypothetical protein OWV82_014347 [Melia azedarach]